MSASICENCSQPVPEDEIQTCAICGVDGLGNCCIGQDDHPCEGVSDMQDPLSYTECWESIMGRKTADTVVAEFDLVPEGLDEWVAEAELAAISQLAVGYQRKMLEEACSLHHDAMVSDLIDAIDRAGMEASF